MEHGSDDVNVSDAPGRTTAVKEHTAVEDASTIHGHRTQDGHHAQMASEEAGNTVLTIGDDFERFDSRTLILRTRLD